MNKLEERSGEMEFEEFLKLQDGLAKQLISYDKQVQEEEDAVRYRERECHDNCICSAEYPEISGEEKQRIERGAKWLRMEKHMLMRNGVSTKT